LALDLKISSLAFRCSKVVCTLRKGSILFRRCRAHNNIASGIINKAIRRAGGGHKRHPPSVVRVILSLRFHQVVNWKLWVLDAKP
jgi:hypothetical protein